MADAGGHEVGRISVRVLPNTSRFRRDLKDDLERVEDTLRGTVQMDAELNTAGAIARMRETMARLQAMGSRGVDIDVGIDRNRLSQLGATISTALSSALSDTGANGAKGLGGLAGGAGNSVAGTVALVAAISALVAPATGLVASLIAGLPSLAAGFGATAGAIALGLDGIKASAASLKPDLDALKASVSGVFEQRLTPIFDQLKGVFPTLKAGMGSVANGLADMFQGMTSAVTSGGGLAQIQNILSQTGGFLSSLQPVVGSFTDSFLKLASSGASSFGLLTSSLSTFANGFGGMVDRITSNGSFDSAMQGLSVTLDSVLGLFNRLMEVGVTAMGQLGGPLSTLINGLGDAFVAAMPALTSFSSVIANVLGTALTQLAPVITALTPAFTQLMSALGEGLTGNLQTLGPALTQIGTSLGGALTSAVQTLAPKIPELVANFSKLAQTLGPALSGAIDIAAKALPPLVSAITFASQGFAALIGTVAAVAAKFTEWAGVVASTVGQVVAKMSALGGQILSAVGNFSSLLVQSGKDLIQGLINGIGSMIGAAVAKVRELASTVVDSVKGALGIHSPSRVFTEIGQFTGQGLVNGLNSMQSPVAKAAQGLADSVANAMTVDGVQVGKSDFNASDYGKRAIGIGENFAKATGGQLMQDLGIGGNGALEAIAGYGLGFAEKAFGSTYNFHVSNADDAMAIQRNQQNKQLLGVRG